MAPSSAASCQPPLGERREAAVEAHLAHRAGVEEARQRLGLARVGGDVEVERVEVAQLAELDHAGEFGIVGGVGESSGIIRPSGRARARGGRPKFLEFRPCAE